MLKHEDEVSILLMFHPNLCWLEPTMVFLFILCFLCAVCELKERTKYILGYHSQSHSPVMMYGRQAEDVAFLPLKP
jgi:hypothetical protein